MFDRFNCLAMVAGFKPVGLTLNGVLFSSILNPVFHLCLYLTLFNLIAILIDIMMNIYYQ